MRIYITSVFGAPLRGSRENMELASNSKFFPELEFLELDAFGTTY